MGVLTQDYGPRLLRAARERGMGDRRCPGHVSLSGCCVCALASEWPVSGMAK